MLKTFSFILMAGLLAGWTICPAQTDAPTTQNAKMSEKDSREALQIFVTLYADDFRTAMLSPDKKDDVEEAGKLLTAAKASKSQPALVWLLCGKSYELAAKLIDGYLVAADAMQFAADNVPEKRAEAMENLLVVLQKHIATLPPDKRGELIDCFVQMSMRLADLKADEDDFDGAVKAIQRAQMVAGINSSSTGDLKTRLETLIEGQRIARQIGQLITAIKADPKDDNTRNQIITLFVAELNQPAKAVEFLSASIEEKTRAMVPLAAKKIEDVAEADLLKLADWYKQLATKVTSQNGKINTLTRAKQYYDLFLAKHSADDLAKATATLAGKQIEAELVKFIPQPSTPKPASTINLKGIKILVVADSPALDGDLAPVKKHLEDAGVVFAVVSSQNFGPDNLKGIKAVLILNYAGRDRNTVQRLAEFIATAAVPCVLTSTRLYSEALFFKQIDNKYEKNDSLLIKDPQLTLAAGLSKNVKVTTEAADILCLTPCDPATTVAFLGSDQSKAVILGVEKGAKPTADKKDGAAWNPTAAPARRVMFLLGRPTPNFAKFTPEAWKLLDAAIYWSIGGK